FNDAADADADEIDAAEAEIGEAGRPQNAVLGGGESRLDPDGGAGGGWASDWAGGWAGGWGPAPLDGVLPGGGTSSGGGRFDGERGGV
ncbi:hypothetical protein J8J40_29795, partial [Mycobacterium tuberculosis]|nr:hypothetical protein [Mycobacterium tuberculosis]